MREEQLDIIPGGTMMNEVRKNSNLQAKLHSFLAVQKNWRVLVAALVMTELLLVCGIAIVAAAIAAERSEGAAFFSAPGKKAADYIPGLTEDGNPQQNHGEGGASTIPAAARTEQCGEPMMVFATAIFTIQMLEPGVASLPQGAEGFVFRYPREGYTFAFGSTPASLELVSGIQSGDLVTITEADCSTVTFALSSPGTAAAIDPAQDAAPAGEIVLMFEDTADGASIVVHGRSLAIEPIATDAPPAAGEIEAEISLIETVPSADGSALQVRAAVRNYGSGSFVLSRDDVHLIAGDTLSAPLKTEPALPHTFKPGTRMEFVFTFPRPSRPEPSLQIFTAEVLIEGY